jgi:hypothetical protein
MKIKRLQSIDKEQADPDAANENLAEMGWNVKDELK